MTQTMQFRQPCRKSSCENPSSFSSKSRNKLTTGKDLEKKFFFVIMVLFNRRMQFQPCNKILGNSLNIFSSTSEITYEKTFSNKKFLSSKFSRGHVQCNFDNPAKLFFRQRENKVLLDIRKLTIKIYFCKLIFPRYVPPDNYC